MPGQFRWFMVSLLVFACAPATAQMVKWVDDSGCTHYGETCPKGEECTAVEIAPGPGQDQVEAAKARSIALSERNARRAEEAREPAPAATATGPVKNAGDAICAKAWSESEILQSGLPVYRDNEGVLHHRQSLNDHLYQGERHYLDDAERAAALLISQSTLENQCSAYQPAQQGYVYRFVAPPTLDELIELLEHHPSPQGPPAAELCPFARRALQDFEAEKSGIPSGRERRFMVLVDQKCP